MSNYFSIWCKFLDTGKKEKIDFCYSKKEAMKLVFEYSLAFGKNCIVYCPQLENLN